MTERLFGPYGTQLAARGAALGEPGLSNPVSILNGRHCGEAVTEVARGYLGHGATLATVNGFGLRGLLHQAGEERTYDHALAGQNAALQVAIGEQPARTRSRIHRVMSFGPEGDCYDPRQAPSSSNEARDFHGRQAHNAKRLEADIAWFETVTTAQEGLGMALAAQHHKVPCVISFVIDRHGKLLDGTPVQDAIRVIDATSGKYPIGYSLNCAPIEGIHLALKTLGKAAGRMFAVYPNASSKDPRTLEASAEIVGVQDPRGMAHHLHHLAQAHDLKAIGGCCGFEGKDIAHLTLAVRNRWTSSSLPQTDLPPIA